MDDLEVCSINKLNFKPLFYYRHVDDILLCIPKNMIDTTVNMFNSYDQNLQFTVELPLNNSISFLDLQIIVNKYEFHCHRLVPEKNIFWTLFKLPFTSPTLY